METSTDDDGDPATAQIRLLMLCIALAISFQPAHKRIPVVFKPPLQKEAPVAKKTKAPPLKKRSKKKLYLTFDDGPNRGTKNVLHIVQDEEVPVTFFVVGEHVFASAVQHQLWDSLQIANHIEICNHSYSHANGRYEKYYGQPDSVVKDFKRTQDSLGLTNAIVRTPGRNIWRVDTLQYTDLKRSAAAADSLQKAGFVVMGWDLEWHFDHKTMSVTTAADDLVRQIDSAFARRRMKIADHLVILAHDQVYQHSSDSQQLRTFLQLLKKKGDYEFALMTAYPLIAQDSLAQR
ncbi:MAG: hypothetical protein JWP69_2421 [Flaviaesturariibacter sp.]|nr:hypothetical protein [Flaviaesturariibacter sp.]